MIIKLISEGNLLFRGSDDKELLDHAIIPPLLNAIAKQIRQFCKELLNEQLYCLSWRIHKDKFFKENDHE